MAMALHALPVAALALAGTAAFAQASQPAPEPMPTPSPWTFDTELRALRTWRGGNTAGPLAEALRLQPGLTAAPASSSGLELHSRARWRGLSADALLAHEHTDGGRGESTARFNELEWSCEAAGWAWNVGKKIVGWDVGQGFRPNDVVQQEQRRSLLASTLEGRPLLQAERFGADAALSLVWVNPHHLNAPLERQRRAEESALAARWYRRDGALDLHGTARLGRRTGASLGAAFAWVAGDEVELHASARWLQRHDGWALADGTGGAPVAANPWQLGTQGAASQWLLGASWTGARQISLLAEAWHDGSAPSRRQWRDWQARNTALASVGTQLGLPDGLRIATAGNLAWQTTPFDGASLQRDNLYIRLAWQPEGWQASLDGLYHPADHGRVVTAGLQWQGDRWRLNAAWRRSGGPAHSVLAQLPTRTQAVLAATRSF
jgi:hypothetical protein